MKITKALIARPCIILDKLGNPSAHGTVGSVHNGIATIVDVYVKNSVRLIPGNGTFVFRFNANTNPVVVQ